MKANDIEMEITRQEIRRLVDEIAPCHEYGRRKIIPGISEHLHTNEESALRSLALAALALAKGEAYIP